MAIQQSLVAMQAVLDLSDVPIGTIIVVFSQSLGGAVFVSVGKIVLQDRFLSGLKGAQFFSQAEQGVILRAGLTEMRRAVPPTPGAFEAVLEPYVRCLQKVSLIIMPSAALAFFAT